MNPLKKGDKLVCKKDYFYNNHMKAGDVVTVMGFNEYNVSIKTHYGKWQSISYTNRVHDRNYVDNLKFWDLFYTPAEWRQIKLQQILED